MMSWRRGQAYAQHLRDRVLAAVDRGMGAYEAVRLKVKAEPDLTLGELQAWLRDEHQLSISVRGMWKTLRQLDLTRKKRPSMPRNRTVPTSPRRARIGATVSRS